MNYLKNQQLKTTADKKEEGQRIDARKKNYEVVSEIKKKYSIAGNDEEGVWTFSKMIADEIAKKYNGDVQQDGSKWYVSLRKYAKGGKVDGEIYIVHFEINGKKHTSEYLLHQGDRVEKMLPPIANIISIKKKTDENEKK